MEAFYFLLGAFFNVMPFVMAMVIALGFCLFCLGAYNSPVVGVWGGVMVYLLMQVFPGAALNLGLNLSLFDFYFVSLAFVAMLRMLFGQLDSRDRIVRCWLLIAAVWGALFAVGLAKYKTAAGVEFRSTFYAAVCVIYLLGHRLAPEQTGRLFKALYAGALALLVLALYRWGALAMGERGQWYDAGAPLRVLNSGATMVIAMAMLPGLAMWMKLNAARRGMLLLAPFLMLAVMVLGHRSVWVATLGALGLAWWLAGRRRKGGQGGAMVPLIVGALALGGLFVLAPKSTITQEFQRSVAETQKRDSTIAWRMDSWKSLVQDWAAAGPTVWPAGMPFGTSKRRYIESQGLETEVGAHSHYVSLLIRGGVLVVFAYMAAQLMTIRRLLARKVAAPDWLGSELPLLFVVANMLYAIVYSADYMQSLFMGLAYTLAVQTGRSDAAGDSAAAVVPACPSAAAHLPQLRLG